MFRPQLAEFSRFWLNKNPAKTHSTSTQNSSFGLDYNWSAGVG